jgi:cell division protein FtsB
MSIRRSSPGTGLILPISLMGFAAYFVFSAVQGEYGVLRRVELEAEHARLASELSRLDAQAEAMSERARRMSDDYLDLDLLDERARDVLGVARLDEIVIE